jgi:hypothetical protein
VTESACGPNRFIASSIPGSQPDDTTLGAFDFGPYSMVSQPPAVPSLYTQSLTYASSPLALSEIEDRGDLGTTRQMASASMALSALSNRSSATLTLTSSATATPSKNAAHTLSLRPAIPGVLGVIFLWL